MASNRIHFSYLYISQQFRQILETSMKDPAQNFETDQSLHANILKPTKSVRPFYNSIKLKSQTKHKIKEMIIIDEDEEGREIYQRQKKAKKKLEEQKLIENEIQSRVSLKEEKNSVFEEKIISISSSSSVKKIETVGIPRIQTRSKKSRSLFYYYDQKNYVDVPELIDKRQPLYKKMIVRKCISLRSREYIMIDETNPNDI